MDSNSKEYKNEFSNIKNVDELLEFRNRLWEKYQTNVEIWHKSIDKESFDKWQSAKYFLDLVEIRINQLFKEGHTIDKIKPKVKAKIESKEVTKDDVFQKLTELYKSKQITSKELIDFFAELENPIQS